MIDDFSYHDLNEADKYAFYMIPKELFTNDSFKDMSTDAKLLYGVLRDRNQLSIKNKWIDEEGHIFIIFRREEVQELLGFGNKHVIKLFKELTSYKLIRDVRQGLNKPNIIYVGKIKSPDVSNGHIRKCSKNTSGNVKRTYQKQSKRHTSNTDVNNTDFNDTNTHTDLKTLCAEIQETLSEKISQKKVKELIDASGADTVKQYINTWDKYRPFAKQGQAAYFIYCIQHQVPIPQQTTNKPKYADFRQREYDEAFYEKFIEYE